MSGSYMWPRLPPESNLTATWAMPDLTGFALFPNFRPLSRSLQRHSSVAKATFTPSVQPSLALHRTRPHWLRPSTPFWPYGTHKFFTHAETISILFNPLYSLTPFLFQLSYAPPHSQLYPFVTLQPNFSKTSSQEHSLYFSQHFWYPITLLRTTPLQQSVLTILRRSTITPTITTLTVHHYNFNITCIQHPNLKIISYFWQNYLHGLNRQWIEAKLLNNGTYPLPASWLSSPQYREAVPLNGTYILD